MWRFEARETSVSVVELAEVASLLGLELSVGLHELGDPLRDAGQQALGRRSTRFLRPCGR
jgi:hypothetical protein